MIDPAGATVLGIALILFATGIGALVARRSLIKTVIGLELLGKGVSLLFILGGMLAGDPGGSQAVVFTLIVIEAVIAGLALALAILIRKTWNTFDSRAIARRPEGGGP